MQLEKPQIIQHLDKLGFGAKHYAWPLMKSMFSSGVLLSEEWTRLIDHILFYKPEFLNYFTASYIICNT